MLVLPHSVSTFHRIIPADGEVGLKAPILATYASQCWLLSSSFVACGSSGFGLDFVGLRTLKMQGFKVQ
jgi:hypothetical protein